MRAGQPPPARAAVHQPHEAVLVARHVHRERDRRVVARHDQQSVQQRLGPHPAALRQHPDAGPLVVERRLRDPHRLVRPRAVDHDQRGHDLRQARDRQHARRVVAPEHVAAVDVEHQPRARRLAQRQVEGVDSVERDVRHRLAPVSGARRAVRRPAAYGRDRQPRRRLHQRRRRRRPGRPPPRRRAARGAAPPSRPAGSGACAGAPGEPRGPGERVRRLLIRRASTSAPSTPTPSSASTSNETITPRTLIPPSAAAAIVRPISTTMITRVPARTATRGISRPAAAALGRSRPGRGSRTP